MARYEKERADSARLVPIPLWAYERLGGVEKKPQVVLALSALLGGAVIFEDKQVETPKGVVEIPLGHTWYSYTSMGEDVLATTGASFTRDQFRYAVSTTLEETGIILGAELVHPDTRGKYGKIYRLNPELFSPDQPHVDVVQGYKLFYYGDPTEFDLGEIVVGDLKAIERFRERWAVHYDTAVEAYGVETARKVFEDERGIKVPYPVRRGKPGKADLWKNQVAGRGSDKAAYTSIGRWRQGEFGRRDKPVRYPYFIIDIDREDLETAWDDVLEILARAEERGYDLSRIFVSFSGRRGFHVYISTSMFGSPVFSDSRAAEQMAAYVCGDLTVDIERDKSVESSKSLIRVTGSRHPDTGLYKTTWLACDFRMYDLYEIMGHARGHRPFEFPDTFEGDVAEEGCAHFLDLAKNASIALYDKIRRERFNGGGKVAGDGIKALIDGVAEGENFHSHHVGRNKACYNLACWLQEGKKTGDSEVDAATERGGVMEGLLVWNARNTPSLSRTEVRGRVASARRTVS